MPAYSSQYIFQMVSDKMVRKYIDDWHSLINRSNSRAGTGGNKLRTYKLFKQCFQAKNYCTVQILCIGTDRSQQTVQTKIRLLLKKQSDQGLRCLPFHQHLLDALMQCYIKLFYF